MFPRQNQNDEGTVASPNHRGVPTPITHMSELPKSFQPGPWSVICGHSKIGNSSIGNNRFRILVDINIPKYAKARTKLDKSIVIMGIVDDIRRNSGGIGGFVKRDHRTGRWCDAGDDAAREKVGKALRAAVSKSKSTCSKSRKEISQRKGTIIQSSHQPVATMEPSSPLHNQHQSSSAVIAPLSPPISTPTTDAVNPPAPVRLVRTITPDADDVSLSSLSTISGDAFDPIPLDDADSLRSAEAHLMTYFDYLYPV